MVRMKKTKFDYFDAFEELTKLAVKEAEVLIGAFENFTDASALEGVLEDMHKLEHRGDEINHEIYSSVATDFMPPIDREDIVQLAGALDDVLDCIEDVVSHMYMYDVRVLPEEVFRFGELIRESCAALEKATGEFRHFKKSKTFKQMLVDINTYEETADGVYRQAIRNLHTTESEHVMRVLVWSRIYWRMERCCDACEHAADISETILLKNM